MSVLEAKNLSLGFAQKNVIEDLNLCIEKGKILSILGPNGSGKSTLLRALSRNMKPDSGAVYLNGEDIYKINSRSVARQMAVLPQTPQAPGDITVKELVEYGRFPHQNWWQGRTAEDGMLIAWALEQTGMVEMAGRAVSTLSGGERQRAWIAMALAQKPGILLLDEPTTYLDICHQLEVMELLGDLNQKHGITVVMVLHDINHAAKYSDCIIILKKGNIFAMGQPQAVLTAHTLREVFSVEADIWLDAEHGKPVLVARGLVRKNTANRERVNQDDRV
jgi:iron complex transport system ATP-binding protein